MPQPRQETTPTTHYFSTHSTLNIQHSAFHVFNAPPLPTSHFVPCSPYSALLNLQTHFCIPLRIPRRTFHHTFTCIISLTFPIPFQFAAHTSFFNFTCRLQTPNAQAETARDVQERQS
jgi:hypothetical protein